MYKLCRIFKNSMTELTELTELMCSFKTWSHNLTSSPGVTVVTIAIAITGPTTSSSC